MEMAFILDNPCSGFNSVIDKHRFVVLNERRKTSTLSFNNCIFDLDSSHKLENKLYMYLISPVLENAQLNFILVMLSIGVHAYSFI